jgi:hypothetical protein
VTCTWIAGTSSNIATDHFGLASFRKNQKKIPGRETLMARGEILSAKSTRERGVQGLDLSPGFSNFEEAIIRYV